MYILKISFYRNYFC